MTREEVLTRLEDAKKCLIELQNANQKYLSKYQELTNTKKKQAQSTIGAVTGATIKTGAIGVGTAATATGMVASAAGPSFLGSLVASGIASGGVGGAILSVGVGAAAANPIGLAVLGIGAIGLTATGIHGSKKAHKKRVSQIKIDQEKLEQELMPLAQSVKAILDSPAMQDLQDLLPDAYRNIDAIDFMYERIKYNRSSTLQEAMDSFDVSKKKNWDNFFGGKKKK